MNWSPFNVTFVWLFTISLLFKVVSCVVDDLLLYLRCDIVVELERVGHHEQLPVSLFFGWYQSADKTNLARHVTEWESSPNNIDPSPCRGLFLKENESNFISNGRGVAFYRCAIPNVGSWQVHNQMGNGPTRSIIPFADCMGLSQEIGCWHFKKDDQDPRQSNTKMEESHEYLVINWRLTELGQLSGQNNGTGVQEWNGICLLVILRCIKTVSNEWLA